MADKPVQVNDGLGLPYSLEAEQSVLGAVLVEPDSINLLADQLRAEHFYLPEHQAIYTAMLDKMMANQRIDFVTVLEALKADGYFSTEDGKAYLLKLANMVPFLANLGNYAAIVREKFQARCLIKAAREITEEAMDPSVGAEMLLENAEQRIYNIRQDKQTGGLLPIRDVLASNYEIFRKLTSDEADLYKGIPTGISALDEVTSGLNRSDLIIVGARPGMGKTSFALNIARNVAVQQKRTVAFFNLEMSREQMVNRLLSSEARVASTKLRTGQLTPEEWGRISVASSCLCEAPIYLDDTASITVPEMKARLMRIKDLGLVVVDYLGLMHSAKRTENRVQEVSEITRSLKVMAKELNVPLMVCAQLSRGPEKQGGNNHRPNLSDLRESGSIEQDADQVLFLYRDDYYKNSNQDPTSAPAPDTAEVIVAKNRHGELRTVELAWAGEFTQFTSVDASRTMP